MLNIAVLAAKEAGEILTHYFEMTGLEREVKDDKSFVTKADKESETLIVSAIRKAFPEHGIIGEEGTNHNAGAEYQWIIDPLDGTNNFVNGIPLFAISMGLIKDGVPVAAVVYNPVTNSLFTAEKGKGMYYNGKRATVSHQEASMGFVSFGPGGEEKKMLDGVFSAVTPHFRSKRYLGAAALEMSYVARGGTEAFIGLGLKKWDYTAGALLVQEAGGMLTDFHGNAWTLDTRYFIASNGVAHDSALRAVASLT